MPVCRVGRARRCQVVAVLLLVDRWRQAVAGTTMTRAAVHLAWSSGVHQDAPLRVLMRRPYDNPLAVPLRSVSDFRTALARCGAMLALGLSGQELAGVEKRFCITFPPDLRRLLSVALPLGDGWPDWRNGDHDDLAQRLAWPVEGILLNVEQGEFWHRAWPPRPAARAAAVALARVELAKVPALVPLRAYRYLPADPPLPGNPVLSVHETDIIYYGGDLLGWFRCEAEGWTPVRNPRRVHFWSDLVEGG